MFLNRLPALLLIGLVAAPAVALAKPAARDAVVTHADAAKPKSAGDRVTASKRSGGLCQLLSCSPDQRDAIAKIRQETRERLHATRKANRETFQKFASIDWDRLSDADIARLKAELQKEHTERDRLLDGAKTRVRALLDAAQAARFDRILDVYGDRIVIGGGMDHERGHGRGGKQAPHNGSGMKQERGRARAAAAREHGLAATDRITARPSHTHGRSHGGDQGKFAAAKGRANGHGANAHSANAFAAKKAHSAKA